MKAFQTVPFDFQQAGAETQALANLLATHATLKEKKDILPFFRSRPQLSALCGIFNPNIARFDRIAWEYDLFGDYGCDLVVGDSHKKAYCFLEFEDARPDSVFHKQGKKAARDWSARFEHGYGQLIDWFHKLDGMVDHPDYEARFGKRAIDYEGVLIIGRDQFFQPGERGRLEWRTRHVVVHSKRIHCATFDGLLRELQARLEVLSLVVQANASQSTPPVS